MLVVLDEFTRRCLAILVARRLRSDDVLHCLADLFVTHGPPEHIRSDNGPEFVAINVRDWLGRIYKNHSGAIKTLCAFNYASVDADQFRPPATRPTFYESRGCEPRSKKARLATGLILL